ncbi:DUF2087 domain-containing protein [Clostridium sardiniense]|uniref:DUF2087 domain-containing protein n=1 Tax=Clostridium sardiniense TaxID=29369 RepID=A0ABS7KXY1_CLOSR|nr:DUF2087 domain-containing protein [Clostridium sardiniense]MBY0755422.1 DUF2087 domain-containing protein [Clostridium sardiniense]MDQ0459870.1 hypothetical protein [Clostridium sardiniense]
MGKKVVDIERYLNNEKKIVVWPSKRNAKNIILEYLITKFEYERYYSEKEVNEVIKLWSNLDDFVLLRRELFDNKFLLRESDGSKYWKNIERINKS